MQLTLFSYPKPHQINLGLAMIFPPLPEQCVGCFSGKNSTLLSRKTSSCRETCYLTQPCYMAIFHMAPAPLCCNNTNPVERRQFTDYMDGAQGELTPVCHGKKRAVPHSFFFFTLKLLLKLSVNSTEELVRPFTFLLCRGTQNTLLKIYGFLITGHLYQELGLRIPFQSVANNFFSLFQKIFQN